MATRNEIQAIHSVKDYTQRKARRLYYGTLGNNAGTVDTARNDWVYLRLHGDGNQVVEAYAAVSFPRVANVVVDVEKVDRKGASYYQVLGVSAGITYASTDNPFPGLPGAHAETHQRRDRNTGGYDPLDIYNRALVNLRARAQAVPNLTCYVERGFYVITAFKEFAGGNSPAFVPPIAGWTVMLRWDLLYLGNDDALHILQGTATYTNPTYPTPPSNCIPIAYVIIASTDTAITEGMITDARTILSSNQATATAHTLLDTTVHTDTLTGTVVAGDIIIGNATPKWARLPANSTATKKYLQSVSSGVASWQQVAYADLSGTLPTHDMVTAHSYTGGANLDVFGLSAPNTIARLTPSAAGAASAHLLCTDTNGFTQLTGLGINVAADPTIPLYVYRSQTDAAGSQKGMLLNVNSNRTADGSQTLYGLQFQIDHNNAFAENGTFAGIYGQVRNLSTGTLATAYGLVGFITTGSTGNITQATATLSEVGAYGNGSTIATAYAVDAAVQTSGTGAITYGYGINIRYSGGNFQRKYALYIDDVTGASVVNQAITTNKGLVKFGDRVWVTGWQDVQQLVVTGFTTQTNPLAQFTDAVTGAGIHTIANFTALASGANNDGGAIAYQGKSSTTAATAMGLDQWLWVDATHASRKARRVFNVYDTAAREALRMEASGSAAMLGFFGHAAAVQPAAYTVSNPTANRTLDETNVTLTQLAQIVGTLIQDVQTMGLVG